MKRYFLLSFVMLLSFSLFAEWDLVSQANFPANLLSVTSPDANTIWVTGTSGAVGKSVDNGQTWSFVETPAFNATAGIYRHVEDVSFISATHGALAARSGLFMVTTDGGQTWSQPTDVSTAFGTGTISSVHYLSDGKMWAAGASGIIMYSSDHGVTWLQQTSNTTTSLNHVYVRADGIGFAVGGSGTILKTTDFGVTWSSYQTGLTTDNHLNKVIHKDNIFVISGQNGTMAISTDNGMTFNLITFTGENTTEYCYESVILNNGDIIGVGGSGTIFEVLSGSTTGTTRVLNFFDTVRGVCVTTNGDLYAVASYGAVLKSTDSGQTFYYPNVTPSYDYYSATVKDENTYFVSGNKFEFYKVIDGVKNKIDLPNAESSTLAVTRFLDENIGFVTGGTSGRVFRTINGGDDWDSVLIPDFPTTKTIYDIVFAGEGVVYALSGSNNAKSIDSGANWTLTNSIGIATTEVLYSGYFFDEAIGFAGGKSGALYRTIDSGANWTNVTIGSAHIMDILFIDENTGFLVQANGSIYKTINGGLTATDWTQVDVGVVLDDLSEITIDDNGVLWIAAYANTAGNQGTDWAILKSEDLGETWDYEEFPSLTFNPTRLRDLSYNDGKLVMVGNNGVILSKDIQVEQPNEMNLFFSEYIEGSSNNKAIEIFNPFDYDVNLEGYAVKLGSNGNDWGNTLALEGTLTSQDVYVIYNSASAEDIVAVGDTTSNVTYYNGDDAIGLFFNDVLIDVFGEYQTDPGSSWEVAGTTGATVNHTLVRKPTIDRGNLDWFAQTGTNASDSEWIVYPEDTFEYLGSHEYVGSNVDLTADPVISPNAGICLEAFNVLITCSTEGASIYYTLDGSNPDNNSTLYTGEFEISETTTLKAIAYAPNHLPSLVITVDYVFPVFVQNMLELRQQNADNQTVYSLTNEVFLTFTQSYRHQKYVQDETAGVMIDDNSAVIETVYNIGDGISGLTGKLNTYNGMLQFVPALDPGEASSIENEIIPVDVTL
ncbi:MAG: YCF48-related protein, partial [Candidatus Cloacimonetes bacterium]|nr:YCF48-related protein [Candidatus Cloacimonadota bacterium]